MNIYDIPCITLTSCEDLGFTNRIALARLVQDRLAFYRSDLCIGLPHHLHGQSLRGWRASLKHMAILLTIPIMAIRHPTQPMHGYQAVIFVGQRGFF